MRNLGKLWSILFAVGMLISFAGCKPEVKYIEKEVEKIVEKTEYVCPKCQKSYDTVQNAADCCGVQTVEVVKFICPKDKKEFDTAEEAANCCGVQYETIRKYLCPRDGKEFDTPEEAEECCGPKIEEKLVYTTAVKAGTYTVYHVQQKTTGGKSVADYVLEATDNNKVVTENSTLEDLKNSYTGFTAKALAQNETVLYVFYDRNIITYTFQTGSEGKFNDGSTERIVEGLYGERVPVPIATSSTQDFGGWFTDTNGALSETFGENDLTFTVCWTEPDDFNWYEIPVDAETGNAATLVSKYIYFGVFPKTVLEEGSGVFVDEIKMKEMGANTYYKGNDGNYYAKVSANPYESNYKYSDGSKVISETVRYFKVEPIRWKVLTVNYNGKGNALLLAENILTANVPFYQPSGPRSVGGNIIYPNNYKYSTIRAYLNGKFEEDDAQDKTAYEEKGFLQTAFTANARLFIPNTEVNNSRVTTGYDDDTYSREKYVCENTTDKIFLLSLSEVLNSEYGFSESIIDEESRIRTATDYAKANYIYQSITTGYGGYWRLRSPRGRKSITDYDTYTYYVDFEGWVNNGVFTDNYVGNRSYGIVPALCISLQ